MNAKNILLGVLGVAALGTVALASATYAYGPANKLGSGYNAQHQQGAGWGARDGQGRGMMSGGQRGQNRGGNFIDANNDGICDRMQ